MTPVIERGWGAIVAPDARRHNRMRSRRARAVHDGSASAEDPYRLSRKRCEDHGAERHVDTQEAPVSGADLERVREQNQNAREDERKQFASGSLEDRGNHDLNQRESGDSPSGPFMQND